MDREILADVAERLLKWPGTERFGAKDVLIWEDDETIHIVFKGDARTLQKRHLDDGTLPNVPYHYGEAPGNAFEAVLNRVFDFDVISSRRGLEGSPVGQQMSQNPVLEEFLNPALPALVMEFTGAEDVEVSFMPMEGEPIHPYYSAKARKWRPAGKGPPTVRLEDGSIGVDMCAYFESIGSCGGTLVGMLQGDVACAVTHHTNPDAASANAVRDCGGWIFPSVAVGQTPSATFGPLCLVASVEVVVGSLRPNWRKRSVPPLVVYDTDVWTAKTSAIVKGGSRALYQQLTGTYDFGTYQDRHFWTQGPPQSLDNVAHTTYGEAKIIPSTKVLAKDIKAREKFWSRRAGPRAAYDAANNDDRHTKKRYPYLEGKGTGILTADCWELAIVSESWAEDAARYLKTVGVDVPLLALPDPPSMKGQYPNWSFYGIDNDIEDTYRYSKQVWAALLAYAEEQGLIRDFD